MELYFEYYDGKTYTGEIAQLMADAYMVIKVLIKFNNPFPKPLKITRVQMVEEFHFQLRTKVYRWTYVFFEKGAYSKGDREIVGCISWGDAIDFKPKGDLANVKDFSKVPTNTQVRTYMRHRSLQDFFTKFNPSEGVYCYGSAFGINPKLMGTRNLAYNIFKTSLEDIVQKGYKRACGHAINEAAKNVFRKIHYDYKIVVNVDDTLILDTNTQPFKGLGLSQEVLAGPIPSSIEALQILMTQRAKL